MIVGLRSRIKKLEKLSRSEVDGEELYHWAVNFVREHHPDYPDSWVEIHAKRITQSYSSIQQAIMGERKRQEEFHSWRKEAAEKIEKAIERHGGPEEVESLWRRREFFNNPIDSVRDAIRRDQER